jgi:TolA-binding protein
MARLDRGAGLTWVSWTLAACFALFCVVLLGLAYSFRREAALRRREVSAQLQSAARWQAELKALQTNWQQRLSVAQRQVLEKTLEFERQKGALERQLQEVTARAQSNRSTAQQTIRDLGAQVRTLEDAVEQLTLRGQERMAELQVRLLHPPAHAPARARGSAVWDPKSQRGLLHVEHLPPPPADRDYQLWLYDARLPLPISGGVVVPAPSGVVHRGFQPVVRLETLTNVALSLERKGGADKPQGTVVLASE